MTEAEKRKYRRDKKAEMDRMTAQRERKGLKPWTLSVTPGGLPYGPGVRHWREEIRKLAAVHLDPSCTNIKMQESADMATFKEALELNIEYTRPPLDSMIQTLAGRAVAVRRNWLLAKISRGEEMPEGVSEDHWHQLVMLEASPSHAVRSENARKANAARITLGRTGPKGEVGVTDDLRKRLGREPDPDEVGIEMRRDKGYGGKHRRVKLEAKKGFEIDFQDSEGNQELSDYHGEDGCTEHMAASSARYVTPGTSVTPALDQNMFDPEYVASMQKELAELKAFKEAMVARTNGGGHEGVHAAHRPGQKEKVSLATSAGRSTMMGTGLL